jgi:hypothetical protein
MLSSDVLQEAVEETISTIKAREEEQQEEEGPHQNQLAKLLTVRTDVLDLLVQATKTDPDKKILLTVSHPSDLATAQACLESALQVSSDLLPCELNVASNATNAMRMIMNNDNNSSSKNTHIVSCPIGSTVQDLLQTAPFDSTVHVLESSWQALQREIPLFGDHVPIRGPAPAGGGNVGTGGTNLSSWQQLGPYGRQHPAGTGGRHESLDTSLAVDRTGRMHHGTHFKLPPPKRDETSYSLLMNVMYSIETSIRNSLLFKTNSKSRLHMHMSRKRLPQTTSRSYRIDNQSDK